jgi:hypothetical protein
MTLAVELQVRRAEWMPLRLLCASVWGVRDRRERRAAARALSAMDDHLLKTLESAGWRFISVVHSLPARKRVSADGTFALRSQKSGNDATSCSVAIACIP